MNKLKPFLIILAVCVVAYGVGFALFMRTVSYTKPVDSSFANIDAFAVFTGSAGRVPYGFFQILKGFEGPLLITGVYPGAAMEDLSGADLINRAQKSQITLDYTAQTTRDNVAVTLNWARANNFDRVGIITAPYHMPRSLLVFDQAQVSLTAVPYPAPPTDITTGTLLKEYSKYLAAHVSLV